jgi:hypothetical protein
MKNKSFLIKIFIMLNICLVILLIFQHLYKNYLERRRIDEAVERRMPLIRNGEIFTKSEMRRLMEITTHIKRYRNIQDKDIDWSNALFLKESENKTYQEVRRNMIYSSYREGIYYMSNHQKERISNTVKQVIRNSKNEDMALYISILRKLNLERDKDFIEEIINMKHSEKQGSKK